MTEDSEAAARHFIAGLEGLATVHDLEFEGTGVRWRRVGNGPHLVLFHGGHGSWLHWVRNIEPLAARFTVWLPDLPGFGDSGEIPAPATLERLAAALRLGLDKLVGGATSVNMASFSFGTPLATRLAADRGHVKRFAMVGGTGHGFPRRAVELRKWRHLPEGPGQDEAHRYNLAQQMLSDPAKIDSLALFVHRHGMQHARFRGREISHSRVTREALDRMDLPILMLWGSRDPTAMGEETARLLSDGRASREWKIIDGAGHWLQYERFAVVNELLADWFSR